MYNTILLQYGFALTQFEYPGNPRTTWFCFNTVREPGKTPLQKGT